MYGPSVAKGNFEIDDSTSALAEVNINGDIKKILNQMFEEEEEREEPEYALKICTEKKCLHLGVCTKNLCNDPENLEKMANLAEQGISGMLSKILLLVIYLKLRQHHCYKLSNSQNEPIFTQNGNLFDMEPF